MALAAFWLMKTPALVCDDVAEDGDRRAPHGDADTLRLPRHRRRQTIRRRAEAVVHDDRAAAINQHASEEVPEMTLRRAGLRWRLDHRM